MSARTEAIAHEKLVRILRYDAQSGEFTWLVSMPPRGRIGQIAGANTGHGYCRIRINGVQYYGHRLAWFYTYGRWPTAGIDHIDGNGMNNRLANLREATQAENMQNLPRSNANTSGIAGASWFEARGVWQSGIKINGKRRSLGYFSTAEEAGAAYAEAKRKWHTFCPEIRGVK